MALRDLIARVKLDTSDAQQSARDLGGAADEAQDSLGGIGGGADLAAGGLAALGGAIAAAGVVDFVGDAAQAAIEVGNLSDQTGASVETLSALRAAAAQSGVEFDSLIGAFRTVQDRLVDAATGGADAQESFERLNLSVADLLNLSPEEQFDLVAQALRDIDDATVRAGEASILLGDDYQALLTTFGETDTLDDIIEKQKEFGTVLSEQGVQAARDLNQEWEVLKGQLQATAVDVLPLLTDAVDGLATSISILGQIAEPVLGGISGFLSGAVRDVFGFDPFNTDQFEDAFGYRLDDVNIVGPTGPEQGPTYQAGAPTGHGTRYPVYGPFLPDYWTSPGGELDFALGTPTPLPPAAGLNPGNPGYQYEYNLAPEDVRNLLETVVSPAALLDSVTSESERSTGHDSYGP